MPDGWLTVTQAADRMQRSRGLILRLIGEGRIKAQRMGSIWAVSAKSLERFMTLDRPAHRPKGSGKRRRR